MRRNTILAMSIKNPSGEGSFGRGGINPEDVSIKPRDIDLDGRVYQQKKDQKESEQIKNEKEEQNKKRQQPDVPELKIKRPPGIAG